ncbi:MAG TPA: hypothetical protein VIH42_11755 [Thermoguttaceae bacterium]
MPCIILGAGATAFCDIANPDRRPPLVRQEDLLRIVNEPAPDSVINSPHGDMYLKPLFLWMFEYFGNEIELLFTILYLIHKLSSYENAKDGFNIASQKFHEVLDTRYTREVWLPKAHEVLNKIQAFIPEFEKRNIIKDIPFNILTYIKGLFCSEIQICIGTRGKTPNPPKQGMLSDQHRLLVKMLKPGDAVISFNYDTIIDYALLNENCLNRQSFNPSFVFVELPTNHICPIGKQIKLLKPHGSFNWFSSLCNLNKIGINFNNNIPPDYPDYGVTWQNIILPYYYKEEIIKDYPIFNSEMSDTLRLIGNSDELILIGKQFTESDKDLCNVITEACRAKTRSLIYVDPQVKTKCWIDDHDKLFNANNSEQLSRLFEDLEDFLKPRQGTQNVSKEL